MPSAIFTQIVAVIVLVIEFANYFCNDKYICLNHKIYFTFVA